MPQPSTAAKFRRGEDGPTQTRHPWRSTARTLVAATIGALPIIVLLLDELDAESVPLFAGFLALAGAVSRVMAMPQTEEFLQTYFPLLAAEVYRGRHRKVADDGKH